MSFPPSRCRTRRLPRAAGVCAIVAAGALGAIVLLRRWACDPSVALLVPERGAAWIIAGEPYLLALRRPGQYQARFRKTISVERSLANAPLTIRAFRIAAATVDGALAREPRTDWSRWKEPQVVELAPLLKPGRHTLEVDVVNENGPAALLAYSEELGLATDSTWEASYAQKPFEPATLASAKRPPELAEEFPGAMAGLARSFPLLAGVFLAVALASLVHGRRAGRPAWAASLPPPPSLARWGLLGAWILLGANNILRIREDVGFDAIDHFYYIRYVALTGQIPLAPEGWQMFQSPLYYIISAPLFLILKELFDPPTVLKLLRVVPLIAGAAQVEICHRALRRVFPGRPEIQTLGVIVGGLLPMNLYLSHGLGNEPLAACLSGALIVSLLALVADESIELQPRRAAGIGLLFGLALLSKVTAVLLAVPIGAVIALRSRAFPHPAIRALRTAAVLFGTAFGVCGWYYARNWIALGKPFVGGWDPGRSIVWWQDPGFRSLEDFTSFGTALTRPVYAATAGFWDALYSTFWADGYLSMMAEYERRPPWNYGLMGACALLSLLPSAAIFVGALSPLRRANRPSGRAVILAAGTAGLFLAALLWLYANLPIHSTGKASYMASATVCFAVLAAAGLDRLLRGPVSRALVLGGIAAWAVSAYLGYFVV